MIPAHSVPAQADLPARPAPTARGAPEADWRRAWRDAIRDPDELLLRQAGAIVLNQSVLLRGVNDNVEALAELSEQLFDAGVLPYYLHQLDRVAGVAHVEVDDMRARDLHSELQSILPGYLVPRLVRELAGAPGKVAL